jgi:GTPase
MFCDDVTVTFTAGNGGNGRVSFYPGFRSGPDGGDGGRGGSIFIKADENLDSLEKYANGASVRADDGRLGERFRKNGKGGTDIDILLPIGSEIRDEETETRIDLMTSGQRILLCRGGYGGRGSFTLRSPANTTPKAVENGHAGEEKRCRIIYKIPVDIALIGLSGSGKTTLLNKLTHANIPVPGYPFSTKIPSLGVYNTLRIVDLPSLCSGSYKGKALGNGFLKHAERASLLFLCISASSQDPMNDYRTIIQELTQYNNGLMEKDMHILLTMKDSIDEKTVNTIVRLFKLHVKNPILPISTHITSSLTLLKALIHKQSKQSIQ